MNAELKTTGFASPAQGYEAKSIDLNALLIPHPASTFLMHVESPDMVYKGVFPGSIVIVDRALSPGPGSLAVISHEGCFLCREARITNGKILFTNNKSAIDPEIEDVTLFGTVSAVVSRL